MFGALLGGITRETSIGHTDDRITMEQINVIKRDARGLKHNYIKISELIDVKEVLGGRLLLKDVDFDFYRVEGKPFAAEANTA